MSLSKHKENETSGPFDVTCTPGEVPSSPTAPTQPNNSTTIAPAAYPRNRSEPGVRSTRIGGMNSIVFDSLFLAESPTRRKHQDLDPHLANSGSGAMTPSLTARNRARRRTPSAPSLFYPVSPGHRLSFSPLDVHPNQNQNDCYSLSLHSKPHQYAEATSASGRFASSRSMPSSEADMIMTLIMNGDSVVDGGGSDGNGVKHKHKRRQEEADPSLLPHTPLHSLPFLRRAASSYLPAARPSSKARPATSSGSSSPSTSASGSKHTSSPSTSTLPSPESSEMAHPSLKPKSSFIGVKWFAKRQGRDRRLTQLSETKSAPPAEKETLPPTPPSDSEDVERSHRERKRISVILDDLPLSLSDLGSDSELDSVSSPPTSPPTTPPPLPLHSLPVLPQGQRKNKLQALLISNPYDHPPPPASRRGRLPNLSLSIPRNLNMTRRRSRTLVAASSPVYDEKDGWWMDNRYLSQQDDGGDRVTPITPLSDIVFGDRPPSPKPRKDGDDGEGEEEEEETGTEKRGRNGLDVGRDGEKELASPAETETASTVEPTYTSTLSPTSDSPSTPSPSEVDVHHHTHVDEHDEDDAVSDRTSNFRPEEHLNSNLFEHEYTAPFDHYRDPQQEPNFLHHPKRPQNNPCSMDQQHPESHGDIYCRATSPSLFPFPIRISDREYEPDSTSGTVEESYAWVGYWNRGTFQEVIDELRELSGAKL